jgi:hypothetical protein
VPLCVRPVRHDVEELALEADVGAAATDKMTGNGRGFGFVTFQDKQGARVLLYSTSTLRSRSAPFPCVSVCVCVRVSALVCCGRIAYVVT